MDQDHPSRQLAIDIFKFLAPKAEMDVSVILTALSLTLATVAVEAGYEEEKAVYAFRKAFGDAQRRLKRKITTTKH